MNNHIYHVDLYRTTGRKGRLSSPELQQEIEVATPPEFPGGVPGIWSPEHLFTAAVSTCFMTTFLAIAENSGLEFKSFRCPAKGILDKTEGKFAMTEILLQPVLVITGKEDLEKAERILQKAEKACLITNSISSKVNLQPDIQVLPELSFH
jgi:peroxiredoxin-like protein